MKGAPAVGLVPDDEEEVGRNFGVETGTRGSSVLPSDSQFQIWWIVLLRLSSYRVPR